MKKKRLNRFFVCIIVALAMVFSSVVTFAEDDDEYSGLKAETLTIKVGYYGGPYYTKRVFTVDELWSMDVYDEAYSYIDSMPSACVDYATGVRLEDIMDEAGIDLNSVETFYFYTNDNASGYYTSFPKTSLINAERYYYPNLRFNFDNMTGKATEGWDEDAVEVDAMIALADNWQRYQGDDESWDETYGVNTNTRFRLMFGQTNGTEKTASRSAKWIHSINVMFGGAPSITTDDSILDLEVGSNYRVNLNIDAADSTLEQFIRDEIVWNSSDDSVATVDSKGNVKVLKDGEVTITA
ncbi:MAG: Ig-like domain-containing protein, partial [Intestinibacter sp.]